MTYHIDIETRSRVDITKSNVYRYVECPDFKILMLAYAHNDDPVQITTDQDEISFIFDLMWASGEDLSAHNCAFERVCFSHDCGLPVGTYLDSARWVDPMPIAAEKGAPQKLGNLAKFVGAEEKDSAGTRLINLFCKPNRKGGWNDAESHPEQWQQFCDYCVQDVVTLRDVSPRVGTWPNETEHQVWLADQKINDRGVRIDTGMAEAAVKAAEANARRDNFRLIELTDYKVLNPASNPQMLAWVQGQELDAKNLRAETVTRLLEGELTSDQRGVLELRQELALVAFKKYQAALRGVCSDGRIRGTLRFFGAHTGRWSGSGVQLQNFPREHLPTPEDDHQAILDLKAGQPTDAHILKALVRPLLTGPFTVVDYSAFEARTLAWLSGEQWALDAFEAGEDIYVAAAERMSSGSRQYTRFDGKQATLALGYSAGIAGLRGMGATGEDEELQEIVKAWRKANRRIVRFWKTIEDAFAHGGQAGPHINVTRHRRPSRGITVKIWLPSGRAIHYHNVKHERYVVIDKETEEKIFKRGFRYQDARNPKLRIGTYGGKLAENVTQAVQRDFMAEAIVRLEDRGYPVAAHVHDEAIMDGLFDPAEIASVMCEKPDWAEGLPVAAEGGQTDRYRKM